MEIASNTLLLLDYKTSVFVFLVRHCFSAAESMHALPDIEVTIVEYSELEHNKKNGIDRGFGRGVAIAATAITTATAVIATLNDNQKVAVEEIEVPAIIVTAPKKKEKKSNEIISREKEQMYYMVSCKDNGCGTFI